MAANSYCMLILGIMVVGFISFFASFGTSWGLVDGQYALDPAKSWILVGGVTSSSAVIKIKLPASEAAYAFYVSPDQDFRNLERRQEFPLGDYADDTSDMEEQYDLQTLQVANLEPQTKYYYKIQGDGLDGGVEDYDLRGSFRTPAPEGTRFNFTIAASGCAWTGSRAAIFQEIQKDDPLLFLHLGDFHYADIDSNNMQDRIDAVSQVLASDTQSVFYRSTSFSYMWDDHDWLGNNADGVEEVEGARDTALRSYQMAFPHYSLPALSNSTTLSSAAAASDAIPVPVYQAYTIGTVRFIISDLRSESNNQSIYSDTQAAWLRQELSMAHEYDFVIWVTTKPWIGPDDLEKDQWYGYPQDRASLSAFITNTLGGEDGPQNLLAIAGDAHMVAFDDGTNTYYGNSSGTVTRSFPILQSAALDRVGSTKGDTFTEGCYAYNSERTHQFSTLRFEFSDNDDDDDKDDKCIHIDTYRNEQYSEQQRSLIFSKSLCNKIFVEATDVKIGTCEIPDFWQVNNNLATATSVILIATIVLTFVALKQSDATNMVDCLCKSCGTTLVYLVGIVATIGMGFGTFFVRGVDQMDVTPVLIAVLCQTVIWFFYLFIWWACCTQSNRRKLGEGDPGFRDVEPNPQITISDLELEISQRGLTLPRSNVVGDNNDENVTTAAKDDGNNNAPQGG